VTNPAHHLPNADHPDAAPSGADRPTGDGRRRRFTDTKAATAGAALPETAAPSPETAAALDALPLGYHVVDAEGRVTYLNACLAGRLRRQPEEVLGRVCWEEFPFLARTSVPWHYREALRTGEPRQFVEYLAPMGGWFAFDLAPMPEGLAVSVRDITPEIAAQAECHRLLQENRRLDAENRSYLRDLLLFQTDGRLRLCASRDELPAPLPVQFTGSDEAAAASGAAPGVAPLVSDALWSLRQRVREAAALARLSPDDAEELAAASSEAAMNAVVHGDGGVAEVRLAPGPGIVQVWITDRGRGIPPDVLRRAVAAEEGCSTVGSLGQGLRLQACLCDRVCLLTGAEGTTVVLEQQRRRRIRSAASASGARFVRHRTV
jgi:Anti-sigma regulatory factor (Ser/Thr protein kinase)